ncbi:hypothetical protein FGIG_03669 [Fasciola gigantica]|uniref:Bcl-2 Bcl-2 homology region 1-3 domain-containing protein n=1 Tax=Fasciola gigantica TaxID=46835 RepID=A0A504Y7T0_FASGI|nr:hypothetical protein FGIG_03669 [Fasciola gigantica]
MSTADCTSHSQMTASPMPSAFYEYTKVLCQSFLFSSLNEDDRNRISRLSPPSEQFCPDKLENKELVGILMTLADEIDSRFSQPSNMDQTIGQLGLSDEGLDRVRDVYMEIINVMFRKMNWGRIVAMLAFLRMLAVYLLKRDRLSDVHALIESTAVYCDERLRFWIQMHGGWNGLVDFFCQTSQRSWNSQPVAECLFGSTPAFRRSFGSFAMAAATGALGAIGLAGLCALWSLRR